MACRAVFAEVIQGVGGETPEMEQGDEVMPHLSVENEGLEFSHLLFLPQTMEFVFCLQLAPSVETPAELVETTLKEVRDWVQRFSQQYRYVMAGDASEGNSTPRDMLV